MSKKRRSAADKNIPRPEYPRPQLVREQWLNLNGYWEFRFDDKNVGMDQRWFEEGIHFELRILVPFSFESERSGIADRSFHPCVWYRRGIEIPQEWSGRRILLNFGAVDYRATVWVNGTAVGTHEGGHTPFSCDITGALRPSGNTVTVRAEDPPTDRYIPRGKQHWEEKPVSIFYARTTGIWQTVWLEPVGKSHVERVRITSSTDGAVLFEARLSGAFPYEYVTAAVHREGRMVASGMSLAEGPRASIAVSISDPKLWSPDKPCLYDLRLEVHGEGGVLLDGVASYFGIRAITTQDGKVLLNGEPLFLKTVLDQGYWPESNLTPPCDEAICADIRAAKDMGFNGVRKHQKVEDPRFLYWADKLGLLVCGEMANAYLFDEDSVARVTREWVEVVNRDYNHPCIVVWVPMNESWGVPNLSNPRQQAHIRALYYLTKSLDSTRLVIDNDGWEHTEATDLFAIHDYTNSGDEFYRRYKDLGNSEIPLPVLGKMYLAPGSRYNGSPIFLSEFGGIGYILPEDRKRAPRNAWGYSGVEPSKETVVSSVRNLYRGIARVPRITGICYTQLYDVEQEVNGLLTYDRRPKFDFGIIRKINALLR